MFNLIFFLPYYELKASFFWCSTYCLRQPPHKRFVKESGKRCLSENLTWKNIKWEIAINQGFLRLILCLTHQISRSQKSQYCYSCTAHSKYSGRHIRREERGIYLCWNLNCCYKDDKRTILTPVRISIPERHHVSELCW